MKTKVSHDLMSVLDQMKWYSKVGKGEGRHARMRDLAGLVSEVTRCQPPGREACVSRRIL